MLSLQKNTGKKKKDGALASLGKSAFRTSVFLPSVFLAQLGVTGRTFLAPLGLTGLTGLTFLAPLGLNGLPSVGLTGLRKGLGAVRLAKREYGRAPPRVAGERGHAHRGVVGPTDARRRRVRARRRARGQRAPARALLCFFGSCFFGRCFFGRCFLARTG